MPVMASPECEELANGAEDEAVAEAEMWPPEGEVTEELAGGNEQGEFGETRETAEDDGTTDMAAAEDLEDAGEPYDGDSSGLMAATDAGPCVDCMLGESQAICRTEGCPNKGHRHCDFTP
jgi:hypothetical protein